MITQEFYEQQLDRFFPKRGNGASQHSQREAKTQSMTFYEQEVDRLFRELRDPPGTLCYWPVIGGGFVKGVDNTTQMRRYIALALRARDWFIDHGPSDAPPLPLSYGDREALKHGGLDHMVAWYARSLAALEFDVDKHPSFHDYACGALVSGLIPWREEALEKRFPPRKLDGLGGWLCWKAPEQPQREAVRGPGRARIKLASGGPSCRSSKA
jgi:hypothetical protein